MANLIIGIDVGGIRKGFHVANMLPGGAEIRGIRYCARVADVKAVFRTLNCSILAAIDCPPPGGLSLPIPI